MSILYESYTKSPEARVTGQKKPTEIRIYLWNPDETERMEDKTLYVGTTIKVTTGLFTVPWYTTLNGKEHKIWHRVDTGPWEVIGTGIAPSNYIKIIYTIAKAGVHSFYAEFVGDAEYEGCKKAAKTFAR